MYRAFLLDRCDQLLGLAADARLIVAHTPDDAGPALSVLLPDGLELLPQGPGGLSDRLTRLSARLFGEGASAVVFMDSDSPTLPTAYVRAALARLRAEPGECVCGPADDGGYYLLGSARHTPGLFEGIPWSSERVLAVTQERAAAAGLAMHLLPPWRDVDTPDDLAWLRASLHEAVWPARTAEALRARQPAGPPATGDLAEAPWGTESSRLVYGNAWIRVREDTARLPDGQAAPYGVIEAGQAVGVLPFVDPDTVVLVRQYRYVAGRATWEMPTGGVHAGERLEEAAARECAEEAGYRAGRLTPLCRFHSSKSVVDEVCHLYLGEDLTPTRVESDPTEFLRVEALPFDRVLEMVLTSEITDSMTVIAVLHADRLRRAR